MNKPIYGGLTTAKTFRLIIALILLVVAGLNFNANAQTVTNLYSFIGSPNDGMNPYAQMVQGSDGNLYGTTYRGGTSNYGTVFRISPSGNYTNLWSFTGGSDGNSPKAGLVQGSDGNFYGTTDAGGTNNIGTIFRINTSGTYTNLYTFGSYLGDGKDPSRLVQGNDGNFYGTTDLGGTNFDGTVFRITPNGIYTNLYSFGGNHHDGFGPVVGLVQGSDGNFYGTTQYGGTSTNCVAGCGTIFRISPSGTYTSLYSLVGSPNDGETPFAGLVQGSDGNFYGTTEDGGMTNDNPETGSVGYGTVFRISPNGTETNLHSFGSSPTDGSTPLEGLVQGSDGNLYGTDNYGGTSTNCANGCGTVFRISSSGIYTTLYSFVGSTNNGANPEGLVQGIDGNFYGTTSGGGTHGDGTVFKLIIPLNPPANQVSGFHPVGNNIILNIPSVAYETYQLQFSSSMNPTNWVNVPGVSVTNSIGALLTVTNFGGASQPQGFYRFDITP